MDPPQVIHTPSPHEIAAETQILRFKAPDWADLTGPMRIALDGLVGLWFPMPIARELLKDRRELADRRRDSATADVLRLEYTTRRQLLQEALDMCEDRVVRGDTLVTQADVRARRAEARANHWSRRPGLWIAVGVLTTGAVVAISIKALEARKD